MKNKLVPSSLAVELFNVIKTSNGNGVKVFIETADRKYSLVIGAVTKAGFEHKRYFHRDSRHVGEVLYSDESRDKYIVEKYIAVHQDESIVDRALDEALNLGWEGVLAQHKSSWNKLWDDMQLEIEGDDEFERSVIFNTYHLLQLYNNDAEHFMLPARGLHGNGYRGHVFWDADIYALPFYLHFMPEAARKMLMYRYRGLEAARENAKLNGYRGAQYPWESADDWHEATPKEVSLDLLGKSKVRIETGELEHHITADVAYAVDLYYRMTGDEEFMIRYGLEILFETARFWASRVEFDSRKGLYVIRNVIGPDEYHIHVDNNFYTNIMARHNLLLGVQYFEECMKRNSWKGVAIRLGLTEKEVNFWREIAANMYVPCGENGFCEEFDGYQELEDVSLSSNWRCIPDDIRTRLNSTKLIKQADVVAALFLLRNLYKRDIIELNYEYYLQRTTHESSLSLPMYAAVAAYLGRTEAFSMLKLVSEADLKNIYGNTSDGFHVGSAGGLWMALLYGVLGISWDRGLKLNPKLPEGLRRLRMTIWLGGKKYIIDVKKSSPVDKSYA